MKLESIHDSAFREYGQVLEGYNFGGLLDALNKTPCPEKSVVYVPGEASLEGLPVCAELRDRYYGGLPIQIGYCNGYNTMMNALEYHRDSEVNIAGDNIILLLAKQADIALPAWTLDSAKVRAFLVPAGTGVELYATTLHYAPASAHGGTFRVAVVLPKGTNTDKPAFNAGNVEDTLMTARNKWLIAHGDCADLIAQGCRAGITGRNPDVRELW